jgi:hypothetical protein
MHVAKIPNRNSSPTYFLRENYCDDGKMKHRIIGNIISRGTKKITRIAQVLKRVDLNINEVLFSGLFVLLCILDFWEQTDFDTN